MTDTAILNVTCLLIHHAFVYRGIYGRLPDARYMMQVFEIPGDLADHVLMVAGLVVGTTS